jgi:Domain of unknown function (DUF3387)
MAPTAKGELPLANAMSQLDSGDRDGRVGEGLEPSHRRTAALDGSVILLDDVVEVLASPDLDVAPTRVLATQQPQRAPARHVAIERHFARQARSIRRQSLAKERLCGGDPTVAAEQEVDGLALLVNRSIEIVPLGFDRNVRLIDPPRRTHASRESAPSLLILRNVPSHPSQNRRMRDFDAALRHNLDEIPIRQPIGDVPTHAQLDDVSVERSLAVDRVSVNRLRHSGAPSKDRAYYPIALDAHTRTLFARANRVYPGKDFGLIVDYNGMLKSLREALAQYATGESGGDPVLIPIDQRVQSLIEVIEATEAHLRSLQFDPKRFIGAAGFAKIKALKDAVDAVYTSDDAKRRFEILARQVFIRFKALVAEPTAYAYAERHDNIEGIYKKLTERRDTADVTDLMREIHRIVNEAIRTQDTGGDQAESLTFDLSKIDLDKLRDEFAKKVQRKPTAIQDIRTLVEQKLADMLATNPTRMNYQLKYEQIIADYNSEKDRTIIEETFRKLVELVNSLDEEQKRATREGLGEEELALFDPLLKDGIDKAARKRVKQASRELLAAIKARLAELDRFWEKEQTKGEVETLILDHVYTSLPTPPFTDAEKDLIAKNVYAHVWQQAMGGRFATAL